MDGAPASPTRRSGARAPAISGLAARRDDLGMLEVKLPAGPSTVVELSHPPGPAEWIGLGVTVLTGLLLVARGRRARATVRPAGRS